MYGKSCLEIVAKNGRFQAKTGGLESLSSEVHVISHLFLLSFTFMPFYNTVNSDASRNYQIGVTLPRHVQRARMSLKLYVRQKAFKL